MATIKVGIDVSDNGTANKATQAAERLKNAYDAAASSASKIGAGASKTAGVAQSQAMTSQELVAYNRQRSIAQGTGASSRDFAKQAEGLGGLVRLYATFAANVFAVTAAFNALSTAMDTTNMIKGLDQLGAASGQSLGTLSKRFSDVTDGAISLRESVEAVAKASAAGLSSKQILQIGENAKKASQALGVNMSDAVSRLTRGITKLEPELLDELGIYTKLEESVNKYALRLGKSASSLTDFERRQAFANAVLDEANKKFGAIELDTNPYNKLLATFKNVTFAGLELVNNVLSPVINLLSQSPVALAGILALIGKQLVGSALPALGKFREGLEQQAISSKKALEAAQASRGKVREMISEEEAVKIGENARLRAQEAALAAEKARTVFSTGRARPAFLANIPSAAELTAPEPDLPKLQAYVKEQEKKLKLLKADKDAGPETIARIEAQRTAQKELINSTRELIAATEKQRSIDKELVGKAGVFSKQEKDKRDVEAAARRVRASEVLKGVTEAYDTEGFNKGFAKLKTSVIESRKELGFFRTAAVAAQGSVVLLAGGISQIMSVLSPWLMGITAAVTIFGFLDGVLSKNSKQAEETSKALETVDDALKNVDATSAAILKKDPFERISIESISARAKSINELSNSLTSLADKVEAQLQAANIWDKFINGIKSLVDADVTSKAADKLAVGIEKLLKTAGGADAEEAAKNIEKLVGIDPRNVNAFRAALNTSSERFLELAPKVSLEAEKLSNKINSVADSAKQAGDALDTASKTQSEFVTAALPSDRLSKFGIDLVKAGEKIKESLKDSTSELAVFQKLLKDPSSLKLFSDNFQKYFLQNRDSIQANITVIEAYRAEIQKLEKIRVPAGVFTETPTGAAFGFRGGLGSGGRRRTETTIAPAAQGVIDELTKGIERLTQEINTKLAAESKQMIEKGIQLLKISISELLKKAEDTIKLAKIDLLGNTEEAVKERTKVENSALDLQIQNLLQQKNLIGSQDSLERSIKDLTLVTEENTAIARARATEQNPEALRAMVIGIQEQTIRARKKLSEPQPGSLVEQAQRQIDAQVEVLRAQKTANILRQEGQIIDINTRKSEEALDLQIREAEAVRDRLQTEREIKGFLDAQKQSQLETANARILILQQGKEQLKIDTARQKIELVRREPGVALQQEAKRNQLLEKRQELEDRIATTIEEVGRQQLTVDTKTSEGIKETINQQQILIKQQKTAAAASANAAVERLNALDVERLAIEKTLRQTEVYDPTNKIAELESKAAEQTSAIDKLTSAAIDTETEKVIKAIDDRYDIALKKVEEYNKFVRAGKADTPEAIAAGNVYEDYNASRKIQDRQDREALDRRIENLKAEQNTHKRMIGERLATEIKAERDIAATTVSVREELQTRLKTIDAETEKIRTSQALEYTTGLGADRRLEELKQDLKEALQKEAATLEGLSDDLNNAAQRGIVALRAEITKTDAELKTVQATIEAAKATGLGAGSLRELQTQQEQLKTKQQLDTEALQRANTKSNIENQQAIYQKSRESVEKLTKLEERANALVFEQKLERLNILEKLGVVSTETQIKRQADLQRAQEKENLKNRINSINEERNKELDALRELQERLRALGFEDPVLQSTIVATTAAYEKIIESEEALSKIRQDGIEQLKEQNLLIESQNKSVKALEDAANVSKGAFKTLFSVFAELQKQQIDFTTTSTNLTRSRAAEEEQAGIDYYNNEEGLRNQLSLIDKKYNDLRTKLLLESNQKQFASTKNLFKEKTAAYRIFSGLEKAAASQTLILNLQTTASNIASLAGRVAAGAGQMFAQGGFAGFAGVAAMLAVLSSLGLFKKTTKVTAGPSTEDIQKAQLTGQVYQNNQLVTAKGALGADPTAKLESIDKSLELIKNSGFQDLKFSNTSTNYLQKIEQNTRGLSENLAVSLSGIPSGVQTGVITPGPFGTASKPVSLATGVAGAGLAAIGAGSLALAIQPILSAVVPSFASAALGVLGGPLGIAAGFLLGKNLDKILNSIFGGKTTQTVKDFGITAEGTINSLSNSATALVDTFTTIETTVKGGWFRRNRVFDRTETEKASDDITEYISFLFSDIKNSFLSAGSALGKDVSSVLENYVIEPISISTKDLKPEEIAQVIKNKLSLVFNEIALQALGPLIDALRQPLEEAGTTLTRLATQTQVFSDSMLLLGKNVEAITGTLKVVIADDLVNALGGLEGYQDKIQFFRETFLTEAEQIAPISQKLAEEFSKLGISTDLTREQYKSLVLQQDLTKTSGRETFVALLNLGEAFDKVTDFAEKAKEKLSGFSTTIRNFIKDQTFQTVGTKGTFGSFLLDFQSTLSKSLAGDEKSLNYLTEIAGKTIESARNTATTTKEFNLLRGDVISSLAQVASEIEAGNVTLLSPQQQANVILEQIQLNTATLPEDLAQVLARQIDNPTGLAMGGAFYKGMQMFASGGAFSNSVVNNATMFPLGVMGEAGPEAIMPLTRMNNGGLGVTADVPFTNNQSNEDLIKEVRELKKELEKVRMGIEVTATGTNKTFRLLDRVTENGNAFNVVVTA